jgi:hypothetical protein
MLKYYSVKDERGNTSAALPTMGKTINPMKVVETPEVATISSIELTRNSAQTATTAVLAKSNAIAMKGVISACSSSSDSVSEVGSSYKYACVFNWKNKYLICFSFYRDGEDVREINEKEN